MLCLKPTPRYALCAAIIFSLLFSHGVFAADDDADGAADDASTEDTSKDVAEQWRGVSRIEGRVTIKSEGSADQFTKSKSIETAEVRFTLVVDPENEPDSPDMRWYAETSNAEGSIHVVNTSPSGDSTVDADFSGETADHHEFGLNLDTHTGKWQLANPTFLKEPYTITIVTTHSDMDHPGLDGTVTQEDKRLLGVVFDGTVSGVPGVTTGKVEIVYPPVPDRLDISQTTVGRLIFSPAFDDVELEITSAEYQKWRPLGSIKEPTKPGNNLLLRATLKPKGGKATTLPKIKELKFTLLDTSREPGVCMNWPLDAKDKDYDLRLAATPLFNGTLSKKDQALTITDTQIDDEKHPYAEAQLDSYDFGGKAELMVTAKLADGREVIGKMKQDYGEQDIVRLPRRLGADWVAAQWREDHQVEKLPDDDDNEAVKGQEFNGDGYTLYEEYRGFIENGRHMDGDPKRKDVFIFSFLKEIGRPGIALFGRAAKLRVHGKLQPGEMNTVERLMNGNHRDAPHRVDQHGICIAPGTKNAGAVGIDGVNDRLAFRPRYASHAYVTLPDVEHSPFSVKTNMEKYGFNEQDAKSMFDRTVAHELLHIVGLDHHGEWLNRFRWVYFQGANDYFNPTKRARFTDSYSPDVFEMMNDTRRRDLAYMSRGKTVTLLWEDTKENVADELAPEYERAVAKLREQQRGKEVYDKHYADAAIKLAHIGGDAAFWGEYSRQDIATYAFNRSIRIMQVNGTDSGNEMCLMRYYFGNAYEAKNQKNTYYVVRPGVTKVGKELCPSAKGTGANDADHDPQSRAGDAWAGGRRGNCANNVCPNDAIPPRDMY